MLLYLNYHLSPGLSASVKHNAPPPPPPPQICTSFCVVCVCALRYHGRPQGMTEWRLPPCNKSLHTCAPPPPPPPPPHWLNWLKADSNRPKADNSTPHPPPPPPPPCWLNLPKADIISNGVKFVDSRCWYMSKCPNNHSISPSFLICTCEAYFVETD